MKVYKLQDRELVFQKTTYVHDHSLAIVAFESNTHEPYCCVTTNLGLVIADDMAYLDTNNLPDICNWLVSMGYAEVVAFANSGYCTYPLVRFSKEFLDSCIQEVK